MDKCENHDKVMGRTFDEVTTIKLKVQDIDTKMDGVIDFKNMVHEIIFGNGKPGLKSTVDNVASQLNKQWLLLGIILTSVLTTAVIVIWRG